MIALKRLNEVRQVASEERAAKLEIGVVLDECFSTTPSAPGTSI